MNPEIYRRYTGKSNDLLLKTLQLIADKERQQDCIIRLPLIPDFNNDEDRDASRRELEELGFKRFDSFCYQIRNHR